MAKDSATPLFAEVCPRLQPHATVHPLAYRGERWYLLRNQSNMQTLRLNDTAYAAVALMDGEHSLAEIHALGADRYGTDAPTMDELAQLLMQLAGAHFVLDGMPAELKSLLRERAAASSWRLQTFSPTAVRVPLWNPVKFLNALRPAAELLFAPRTMVVWLASLLCCMVLAIAHHAEIVSALTPALWEPDHALVLGTIYVLIKLVHELSHGLAIRAWGGEVREVGLMFLWFIPCPYVDGSAAALFPDKRKRALVAAAGVLAEMSLAALGLLVFLLVEPGLLRTLALDVMIVGTVSTLLANGNPFLKFDGYYVLEDLIEIPNLASRAQRYYLYLAQRYLLGLTQAGSPVTGQGERAWFLFYAPIALAYRITLLFGVALVFSERYLAAGIAIALLTLVTQLLLPVIRGVRYLAIGPALTGRRPRAVAAGAGAAVLLTLVLGFIPVPATTFAEGVVGTADQGALYAATPGFVRELFVAPYTRVRAGQALLQLENPELEAALAKLAARADELETQRLQALRENRRMAASFATELRALAEERALVEQRVTELILRSPCDGEFAPVDPNALADSFVQQGQLIGHVVADGSRVVKAVVTQAEVGQIRQGVTATRVRLVEHPFDELQALAVRETPGGGQTLPSASLGVGGGGRLAVDARDHTGVTAADPVFTLELSLPADTATAGIGGRAYVRFDHPAEPLATQLARAMEQLLLRRLGV